MNSDEKNRISSTSSEFDPDFRKDRYDEAREDRKFQKGHKRAYDDTIVPDLRKGNIHDPYNAKLGDIDRHNRPLNKPLNMDYRDINREESPTNKDLHHLYIPEAKITQPKQKSPKKVHHERLVDVTSKEQKEIKRSINDTEIIRSKQTQFPTSTHTRGHDHHGQNK